MPVSVLGFSGANLSPIFAGRQRLALARVGSDGEGRDQRNLLPLNLEHRVFSALVQEPFSCLWHDGVESGFLRAVQRPLGI